MNEPVILKFPASGGSLPASGDGPQSPAGDELDLQTIFSAWNEATARLLVRDIETYGKIRRETGPKTSRVSLKSDSSGRKEMQVEFCGFARNLAPLRET